jgi:hypothetical protein
MDVHPAALVEGEESYEHLGAVKTFTMDMHPRYEALLKARRVVVEDQDAMLSFGDVYDVPPPVLWSWMNEPEKRRLYSMNPSSLKFIPIMRPGGRTGAGATTHCIHGKDVAMRETVLDWKPFEYYTVEQDSGPMGVIQVTFRLQPVEDGSKTRMLALLKGRLARLPAFLSRPFIRFIYTRLFNYASVAEKLKDALQNEDELSAEPHLGV